MSTQAGAGTEAEGDAPVVKLLVLSHQNIRKAIELTDISVYTFSEFVIHVRLLFVKQIVPDDIVTIFFQHDSQQDLEISNELQLRFALAISGFECKFNVTAYMSNYALRARVLYLEAELEKMKAAMSGSLQVQQGEHQFPSTAPAPAPAPGVESESEGESACLPPNTQ